MAGDGRSKAGKQEDALLLPLPPGEGRGGAPRRKRESCPDGADRLCDQGSAVFVASLTPALSGSYGMHAS